MNFDEAVHGAGGVIVGDDGKPNVATPEATKGLQTLVDWFKDGHIPKAAITWQEEQGRQAFQNGELIFHRNWGVRVQPGEQDRWLVRGRGQVRRSAAARHHRSGRVQPRRSQLRDRQVRGEQGHGGGLHEVHGLEGDPEVATPWPRSNAPTLEALYSDPDIVKKFPYMPTLLKSIQTAKPRPKAVEYGDVTLAIQDAAYGALQGQTQPDAALQALQAKLQTLIK